MNIIIKTPHFIGDTIMMLPALELLKMEYPNAKFTIVCREHSKDIFRGKEIEEIIVDDTKGKNRVKKTVALIKTIRNKRYDLGVLFRNPLVDALIFKLSKIDTIIGYENENRKIFLDFWIKIDRSRHYINHYANLVNQYLDNKYMTLPPMRLVTNEHNLISKNSQKLIGFVLGSDKNTRGYPRDLSLKLFKILKDKNFHIVLLGDHADMISNSLYENQLLEDKVKVTNLSGKTTIAEFIDTINILDILVTIDTSALHVGAATDTNFITLLGKGTSPFDVIKPKVDFGSYLFFAKAQIKDEEFIRQIKPVDIVDEIEKRLASVS